MTKTKKTATAVTTTLPHHPRLRHVMYYQLGEHPKDVEEPKGVSMTVPDMSMSIQELVSRYVRGLPVPMFPGTYSDDEFPDLERMDMAEIQQFKEDNLTYIEQLRDEQKRIEEAIKAKNDPPPVVPLNPPTPTT